MIVIKYLTKAKSRINNFKENNCDENKVIFLNNVWVEIAVFPCQCTRYISILFSFMAILLVSY